MRTVHSLMRHCAFVAALFSPFAGTQAATVRVDAHGAKGDGTGNDAPALQAAIGAAKANDRILLRNGAVYYLAGPVIIDKPLTFKGKATLKVDDGFVQPPSAPRKSSVLEITAAAAGTALDGITVDFAGTGRSGIDVWAPDVRLSDLTFLNYHKKPKSDGKRFDSSESGLRIMASGTRARNVHCEDMHTETADAVPRCVTVQGGASDVEIRNVTGKRINGGVVLGKSSDVRILGYRFESLSDNGIYVLGNARDVVAEDGYLRDTEEPVVFKGANTRVSRLEVINQSRGFGLEQAKGVILEDVTVRYEPGFSGAPAFLRARKANKSSSDILLRNIDADLLMGDSVLSVAYGEVDGLRLENCRFRLHRLPGGKKPRYLVRHKTGSPPEYESTSMDLVGFQGSLDGRLVVQSAGRAAQGSGLDVRQNGRTLRPAERVK